ncbi:MAG TPA: hypothetical protein VKH81_18510 [Candidatus Angelobacter sp.]|nr:hypothetical protein [Candidatus Angelobacter sp.]
MKKSAVTKQQIIEALQLCFRRLKRIPKVRELRRMTGIQGFEVRKAFGTFGEAMRAAGLEPRGVGYSLPTTELLMEWARLARKLGRLPRVADLPAGKAMSSTPYLRRFKLWTRVGFCFRRFAEAIGITEEWRDVLEMVKNADRSAGLVTTNGSDSELDAMQAKAEKAGPRKTKLRSDRPVYGAPLDLPEMAYEPVNESGVMFLFGVVVARKPGLQVHRIQTEFPDCKAMQEVAPGKWQRIRIEFEYASKNFVAHGHDEKRCDAIVCWIHNWPECPETIEVIELRKVVESL